MRRADNPRQPILVAAAPVDCDAVPVTLTEPRADRSSTSRERFRNGMRDGLPFGIAAVLVAVSFGVVAQGAGLSAGAAIAMSVIVFAGSAQFAAIAILAQGGTIAAAIVTAALVNSRFLPMGIALAPSLPGGPLRRALQGQAVVDASWAMAARGDGSFDRWRLFGSTAVQYVGWVGGTVLGALAGGALGDPGRLGLDAVYPAFFLALLLAEMRDRRSRAVALLGAAAALVLIPIAPPGVPVLAASVAALAGLWRGPEAR
jgi:branched chain amino acid efflux pump